MTKVLFVCLGNICRSPLAEFIFRDLADKAGLGSSVEAASCGTIGYHSGEPVDRRSAAELARHGISCAGKTSRQIRSGDFAEYDLIIAMDDQNLRDILSMCPGTARYKVSKLMDHAGGGSVDDPYYTGDFAKAYSDIERGCRGLLRDMGLNRC